MQSEKIAKEEIDPTIEHISMENGGLNIWVSHPVIGAIGTELVKSFKELGGQNYLHIGLRDRETGMELELCIQRKDGKTPAELNMELKRQVADLTKEKEALQQKLSSLEAVNGEMGERLLRIQGCYMALAHGEPLGDLFTAIGESGDTSPAGKDYKHCAVCHHMYPADYLADNTCAICWKQSTTPAKGSNEG